MKNTQRDVSRHCPLCQHIMHAGEQQGGAPTIIPFFREGSYLVYQCEACQHEIKISTPALVATQFGSAVMAVLLIILIVWNRSMLPLWFDFGHEPMIAVFSILTALIASMLILGGVWNALALLRNSALARRAPLCQKPQRHILIRIISHILYSFLPWIYWGGVGFLNDTVLHIDRDWGVLLVLPGLAPFYLAERFGLSSTTIFFLSASYPATGFIYMWMT